MALPNRVLFRANGDSQLWISDGTDLGTSLVKASDPNNATPSSFFPANFTQAGTHIVFTAGDETTGQELWVTDGIGAHTSQLIDIIPGGGSGLPKFLTPLGDNVVFAAKDSTHGTELWITDGTAGGTSMIKDIYPGGNASYPQQLIRLGSKVLFQANDGANGYELWVSDGTGAGTSLLKNIKHSFYNSLPTNFAVIGDKAVFTASDDTTSSRSLWITDGTTGGTSLFQELAPGAASGLANNFGTLNDKAFFAGPGTSLSSAPWVSDGTPAGTHVIHATGSFSPIAFAAVTVPCFAAGTRIATPTGTIAVEDVREGDLVTSAFGGAVAVRWVGHRHVNADRHPDPVAVWPVRVAAGALAPGVPARDLFVSPEHALYLDGHLVPAILLCNGGSISQTPCAAITYFHIELPQHDVVLAEGAACESYLDINNRADFANGGTVITAHPDFAPEDANAIWLANACAPQCRNGPRLEAIRAALARRYQGPSVRNWRATA